jgi:hypothetical protein
MDRRRLLKKHEAALKELIAAIYKEDFVVLSSVVDFSLAAEGEENGYRMEEVNTDTVAVIDTRSSLKLSKEVDRQIKQFDGRKK